MRRIRLTDEELAQVADLRASRTNWAAIGRQLQIGRQIVQREFEEWESQQTRADMDTVRREALGHEFARHVELLSTLAQSVDSRIREAIMGDWRMLRRGPLESFLAEEQPLTSPDGMTLLRGTPQQYARRWQWLLAGLRTHYGQVQHHGRRLLGRRN